MRPSVPRAAFSHCASVGSVTGAPNLAANQRQKASASYQVMPTTG